MTIESKYYPGLNKVLIERLEVPSYSILATSQPSYCYGKIVAKGSIKDSKEISDYSVGDKVYFSTNGKEIELSEGTYTLVNIVDILLGERVNG